MALITREQATLLYEKLRNATETGTLSWRRAPATFVNNLMTGDVLHWFIATFEGKDFALIELSERQYDGETDTWARAVFPQLSLTNGGNRLDYTFPFAMGLGELLDAVKGRVAGVPDLLETLLKK